MTRRAARLVATGAVLVLAPLAVPAAAVESPGPGTDDAPVEVLVSKLAPQFLSDPDQFVQVTGTLTNTGTATVTGLRLRLQVGDRLQSRGQLAQADSEPPPLSPVASAVRPATEDLRPGASATFDLRLRARELGFGRIGVYPFGVQVRGAVDGEDGRQQLGLVQTYLPWFPDGPPEPTRIAWLWPLVDAPSRAPREVMVDDSLAASLGRGGRLSQLVVGAASGGEGRCPDVALPPVDAVVTDEPAPCTVARQVPVTYAVDPDLLFTATALADDDYRVVAGDETVTRERSADAERWLASLRRELSLDRTDLVVLPYADPALVPLAADDALDSDLRAAEALGRAVTTDVVGDVPVLDVAWPPAGPLTPDALAAVVGPTTSAVVLDETALPPPPVGQGSTPDARVALSTVARPALQGLVVDAGLSALLEPGPATAGKGPRLAEQRWLAESAMVVAEAPSRGRTLVVAPPRRASVPQSVAGAVIADTGRVPWLCPVSLRDAADGRDACPGRPAPAEPREPDLVGTLETPSGDTRLVDAGYQRTLVSVRRDGDQLTDAVLDASDEATATKGRLLRARLRAESSAWSDDPRGGRRLLSLLVDDVTSLREQVVVQVGRKVTLTSDKGTIRVSLSNALQQPVTVRVRLTAPAARLSVGTTPEVVVPPRTVRPVDLEVEALVSGQFVVEAQLLDRRQQPFGESTRIVVRSTRYGRVALALTGLGAAGLLVAVGVRIVRRAVRRPPEDAPA